MITDAIGRISSTGGSALPRRCAILSAALTAWLGLAAAAMLPGTIETAMIPAATKSLPPGVAIIDRRGPLLIVQSDDAGYVRALYKAGAGFVLPARRKTCLNLQL